MICVGPRASSLVQGSLLDRALRCSRAIDFCIFVLDAQGHARQGRARTQSRCMRTPTKLATDGQRGCAQIFGRAALRPPILGLGLCTPAVPTRSVCG